MHYGCANMLWLLYRYRDPTECLQNTVLASHKIKPQHGSRLIWGTRYTSFCKSRYKLFNTITLRVSYGRHYWAIWTYTLSIFMLQIRHWWAWIMVSRGHASRRKNMLSSKHATRGTPRTRYAAYLQSLNTSDDMRCNWDVYYEL